MGRVSFFTMLADGNMSWIERSAINSAHDRADTALEVASAQGNAIAMMQRTILAQNKQLKLLNAAIGVLAAVLRDNNVIDPEILDARLEAAILNTEEEVAHEANTTTCLNCGREVPKQQTVMTEAGVFCDRCHAIG